MYVYTTEPLNFSFNSARNFPQGLPTINLPQAPPETLEFSSNFIHITSNECIATRQNAPPQVKEKSNPRIGPFFSRCHPHSRPRIHPLSSPSPGPMNFSNPSKLRARASRSSLPLDRARAAGSESLAFSSASSCVIVYAFEGSVRPDDEVYTPIYQATCKSDFTLDDLAINSRRTA